MEGSRLLQVAAKCQPRGHRSVGWANQDGSLTKQCCPIREEEDDNDTISQKEVWFQQDGQQSILVELPAIWW